jgi:hypothetical protein
MRQKSPRPSAAEILARAAYPQRRSSNANSLWGLALAGPTRVVLLFQIHGSRTDSGVRVLPPQPRSRLFRRDDGRLPTMQAAAKPIWPRNSSIRPSRTSIKRSSSIPRMPFPGSTAARPIGQRDKSTAPCQSNIHAGRDGSIHVVGSDIRSVPHPDGALLYARSMDGGKSCVGQHRLKDVGELPQIVDTRFGLLIAGPEGYYTSTDGTSFSPRRARPLGLGLTRLALSPDRGTVYAVGDATAGGLRVQTSADGGRTWRVTRVNDAPRATAWRYPAVHVDARGRVHVVWMDDRAGFGAIYHAYSDNAGRSFAPNTRVSDRAFVFPANAPAPPPATQNGTWVGDYLSVTTSGDRILERPAKRDAKVCRANRRGQSGSCRATADRGPGRSSPAAIVTHGHWTMFFWLSISAISIHRKKAKKDAKMQIKCLHRNSRTFAAARFGTSCQRCA